jgi:hypothetical protein
MLSLTSTGYKMPFTPDMNNKIAIAQSMDHMPNWPTHVREEETDDKDENDHTDYANCFSFVFGKHGQGGRQNLTAPWTSDKGRR